MILKNIRTWELWDYLKTLLSSPRMLTVMAGGKVYIETDNYSQPEAAEDTLWGRLILVPSQRMWDDQVGTGPTRSLSFLVRAEVNPTFVSGTYPARVLDALQDETSILLQGTILPRFSYVMGAFQLWQARPPQPMPLWDEERGVYFTSSEWRCEVAAVQELLPLSDTFTRADGSLGLAETAQPWITVTGQPRVISNAFATAPAIGNPLIPTSGEAVANVGSPDVVVTGVLGIVDKCVFLLARTDLTARTSIRLTVTGGIGLLPSAGPVNTIGLSVVPTSIVTSLTPPAFTTAYTPTPGDSVQLIVKGNQVTVKINGVVRLGPLTTSRLVSDYAGLGVWDVGGQASWQSITIAKA